MSKNKFLNEIKNKPKLNDYFEWDVGTWSKAIVLWDKYLKLKIFKKDSIALEIGARGGGLSLYLAYNYNISVICSDLNDSFDNAKRLHQKFLKKNTIKYDSQNCLKLTFEDNSKDVFIFKSVIGALGNYENQEKAINEIYRVLKPGGVLLFAENGKSSALHNFLRKTFNKWSRGYWYYPTYNEMNTLLGDFKKIEIQTHGFLTCFFRNKYLKSFAEFIDFFLCIIISKKYRYVIYGAAIK